MLKMLRDGTIINTNRVRYIQSFADGAYIYFDKDRYTHVKLTPEQIMEDLKKDA